MFKLICFCEGKFVSLCGGGPLQSYFPLSCEEAKSCDNQAQLVILSCDLLCFVLADLFLFAISILSFLPMVAPQSKID